MTILSFLNRMILSRRGANLYEQYGIVKPKLGFHNIDYESIPLYRRTDRARLTFFCYLTEQAIRSSHNCKAMNSVI